MRLLWEADRKEKKLNGQELTSLPAMGKTTLQQALSENKFQYENGYYYRKNSLSGKIQFAII